MTTGWACDAGRARSVKAALLASLPIAFAARATAHEGHGATSLHIHVAWLPVDVGVLSVVAVAVLGAIAAVVQRRGLLAMVAPRANGMAPWARRILRALAALVVVGGTLAVWAFVVEPDRITVRHEELRLTGAPALDGLRVALLADIHAGAPHIDEAKLDDIVAATNAERADVVLLLGDYVIQGVVGGTPMSPETIAAHLGGLRAPLGVWAVLGNHDNWLDGARVARALESVGIQVLEDEAVRVDRSGASVWLAGIDDLWTRKPDVAKALAMVVDDGPVVLFTHNPDLFPHVPARVALTVAGHTHGGQVDLPLFGRLVVPSDFGGRFADGHVVEEGRHLFVSHGIGTSILPVRFRVPPEVVVLTLRR